MFQAGYSRGGPPVSYTMKKTLLYLLLVVAVSACKKGDPFDNRLPDTRISLEAINLEGEDRLRSIVELSWSGSDVDGYVTGYELSFDNQNWFFTQQTDSIFKFSLPLGLDTTDINFYVRSMDDDEAVDGSPAYLRIPIRNSAPTALFDTTLVIPDTSYIVTTMFLDVEDLDGEDNLDSIYIKVNNGAWYSLSPTTKVVSLIPDDPQVSGSVGASVLIGGGTVTQSATLQGLNLNGSNIVYLRASDIAGSDSEVDTSKVFFVKHQTSDLLVVDAHAGGSVPSPEEVLYPALQNAYAGGYDRIDLELNDGINKPNLWTPTFSIFLSFYDKVFWYSDESEGGFGILEEAAGAAQDYLNGGGKMLISTGFPSTFDNSSVVLEFTPVDSVSTFPGLARLPTGNQLSPEGASATNYDTLAASSFIGRATPIYVASTAETIYTGDIVITGGWVGPTAFGARSTNGANNTNVVFISVELHKVDGNVGAIETLFDQVLNNEFNW